jgi:hypothetical protein
MKMRGSERAVVVIAHSARRLKRAMTVRGIMVVMMVVCMRVDLLEYTGTVKCCFKRCKMNGMLFDFEKLMIGHFRHKSKSLVYRSKSRFPPLSCFESSVMSVKPAPSIRRCY